MTELTDREIFQRKNSRVFLDIEVYQNYFLIALMYQDGGEVYFEGIDINRKKLRWILENNEIVTFNGNNFDIPLILYFLFCNASEEDLYHMGGQIIHKDMRAYEVYRSKNIPYKSIHINHIDLIEVAFGKGSLKTYAGRIHAPYMQDLPYDPDTWLDDDQKEKVKKYCVNDLLNTKLLYESLEKDIDLRREMSIQYSSDVRSKSDAQIAEVVIEKELRWKFGVEAQKTTRPEGHSFKYNLPNNISFETDQMKRILDIVVNADFKISETGKIVMPGSIKHSFIRMGESVYNMGIGGLHSTEEKVTHTSDDEYVLIDRDVTSYYPFIILNQKLYPQHLGKGFLDVYKSIVNRRLEAKREGNKTVANALKITINGSFGKFGSEHSILYSPELLIQVTISGQLYLLMMIERLEAQGFSVVSANTDGIVTRVKRNRRDEFEAVVSEWESLTGFSTEETEYTKLCSRDVNNYIAFMPDGEVKTKGAYAKTGMSKNPSGEITIDAVIANLKDNVPVEKTISECKDIRKFVFIRKVDGGCVDEDQNEIGKVIRYYFKRGCFMPLRYKRNGNKVPKTQGAYPIMDLTVDFPQDIAYAQYFHESKKILREDFSKPEQLSLL